MVNSGHDAGDRDDADGASGARRPTAPPESSAELGELAGTADDLGSLLTSTDIAVLFLDPRFRVRRFTPAVKDLLDLIPSDVGRPFVDLRRKFADPELMTDAQAVLERRIPIERAIESERGRAYLRRVLPYRTQDGRVDGVVVAFVDVSEHRRADAALRESEASYHALFEAIDEAYAIVEVMADAADRRNDFLFLQVNPAFLRHTGMEQPVGKTAKQLLGSAYQRWAELYGRVAESGESIRLEESDLTLGHVYDLNIFRLGGPGSRRVAVLFTNITGRKRAEAALKAVAARDAFLVRLSDALRPLADPLEIQIEACRLLGEHLGVDRAYFVEVDEDAGRAEVRQDYLRGDSPSLVGSYPLADFGWVLPPMRRGELLVVPDVVTSPLVPAADQAMMAAVRVAAHITAPLVKDGRLVAGFFVTEAAPRAWTTAEAELVRDTAERIWAVVERARAEAAVRTSEGRLRAVAAHLPSGAAFVVDHDLRYTLADGQAVTAAGFTSADFEGKTLAEALPAEDLARFESNYRRALAGERFRVEHPAHGRLFVTHGGPLRDTAGRVTAALAVSYDLTDLRRAEERLQLALTAARMGIWTLDVATGAQLRDANLNRLLGLEPVETTQPFAEFLEHIHADDRDTVSTAFASSLRDERPLSVEFRVVRPDGEVRWLRDQGDVFGDLAARRRHMAGACVDVTERRVAEDAVRGGEERLRLILASATDYAILTLTDDREVTSWSSGAAATFGYAEAEILGRSADLLFTPEDRAAGVPEQEFAAARQTGRAADERWHLRRDGSRFYASGVLTRLASGEFVKVARDLTDRKRTEDAVRYARDRLEERVAERTAELAAAVRSLEAEIVRRRELALRLSNAQEDERKRVSRDLHDTVGQTHVALTLALAAAARTVAPGSEAAGLLAYAGQLAETVGREMHDVAVRLRPTALDDLGLAIALKGLVRSWSRHQQARIELHAPLDERLPAEVETALYRLVQEALTNVARHAQASTVSVVVTRQPGQVTAVVEDDGAGFDPAAAAADRLGLRGMRERVTLLGGELCVESSPDAGTSIIARIPLRETLPS